MKYLLIAILLVGCITDNEEPPVILGISKGTACIGCHYLDGDDYREVIIKPDSGLQYKILIADSICKLYYDDVDFQQAILKSIEKEHPEYMDGEITLYDKGQCITWQAASVPCIPYKKL